MENYWVVVVDLTQTVELVLGPLALVGKFPSLVEEFAVPVHFVVPPLPFIVPSVLVEEPPSPVPHASALEPFVSTPSFILLSHVFFFDDVF